jgi:hypothetical protein
MTIIRGFAVDGSFIYTHAHVLGKGQIVRMAKDGADVSTLYESIYAPAPSLLVDQTNVYFTRYVANCMIEIDRVPKVGMIDGGDAPEAGPDGRTGFEAGTDATMEPEAEADSAAPDVVRNGGP